MCTGQTGGLENGLQSSPPADTGRSDVTCAVPEEIPWTIGIGQLSQQDRNIGRPWNVYRLAGLLHVQTQGTRLSQRGALQPGSIIDAQSAPPQQQEQGQDSHPAPLTVAASGMITCHH